MTNKITRMWSENHKRDMWWVEDGDSYFGPFKKRHQAERFEKPFDITQHELNDHLAELESGNLGVNDCGWIIDKERAIAIAKHFKLTAEDLK